MTEFSSYVGRQLIGGQWIDGAAAEWRSVSPVDARATWQGAWADEQQASDAVAAAREALESWSLQSLERRAELCRGFAQAVDARRDELAELIAWETGKPRWEALSEVAAVISKVANSIDAQQARRWTTVERQGQLNAVTRYKPHGVMLVLGPFNLPAHLPGAHMVPALLAGNTIVFKPSEMTPAVGQWLAATWQQVGLPNVVNLYSSAVFIGWASVLFAMILELIYPLGICNVAAALIGASTLSIARSLDSSDTMHVLEAVLDTQFWLSTHVITVTLGYGATFLAGMFGIIALSHRMASGIDRNPPSLRSQDDVNVQQILNRIIYGVLCFAILFSFIGTVLGGLWADDSWGRFWGWDPKENGALMIVLWNALVLHANWDRMVGQRGLAVLAVLGNIVTSWSWFGTNQLGIGLHSYGFTSAVLATLALVVVGHVAFVIVSLLATRPALKSS